MVNPRSKSPINDVLENVYNVFDKKHSDDKYALQDYDKIAEIILKTQRTNWIENERYGYDPLPRISQEDKPIIEIVKQVAGIVWSSKAGAKEELRMTFDKRIDTLEALKSDINTKSFTNNEKVNDYCNILIDEFISWLKNHEISSIENKVSSHSLSKLGASKKITPEQRQLLREEKEQFDLFFDSFDKYLSSTLTRSRNENIQVDDSEGIFDQFILVWTAAISRFWDNPKKQRKERIKALDEVISNLPKGITENPEIQEKLKANLNFMLALALLAKEGKSKSPKEEKIEQAKLLLEDCKKHLKPAELLLQTNFKEFKTFNPDPEEMKLHCNNILAAIEEAGCKDLVSKRDLNDVFKMMNPAELKKEDLIRNLKTIAAVLSLPIVWSAAIILTIAALALAAVLLAIAAALGILALICMAAAIVGGPIR